MGLSKAGDRMANTFLLEGLVLKGTDYGETDRIITLYTRERGKVHALAKGVRKGKSRLRGCGAVVHTMPASLLPKEKIWI